MPQDLSTATLMEIQRQRGLSTTARVVDPAEATGSRAFDKARQAEAAWRSFSASGHPTRAQVDPLALGAALLPYVVIIEVLDDGFDFRWRLFGSRHEAEYGADLTGTTVRGLMHGNPSAGSFLGILAAARRAEAPTYFRLSYLSRQVLFRNASGVFLPLSDDGANVSALLGCADWSPPAS